MRKLPWLAGYLEGEGSFYKNPKTGRKTICASTIDADIAARLQGLVEGSCLSGPYEKKGGRHVYYQWSLNKHAEVRDLATRLRPRMGVRRQQQIDRMLEA